MKFIVIQQHMNFCQIVYQYWDFFGRCGWSFQVHIFNFTGANISRFWSILGILEPCALLFSFSAILLGDVIACKKRKIHEEKGERRERGRVENRELQTDREGDSEKERERKRDLRATLKASAR